MKPPEFPELFVEDGTDRYYVRGGLRERPDRFRTAAEGRLMARLAAVLGSWQQQADPDGEVLIDMGYRLRDDPPTAVGVPVSYVDGPTARGDPADAWWLTNPPRLAVEIVRFDEPSERLTERVAEYLGCGVPAVWVVNLTFRGSIAVHRPGASPIIFSRRDTLTGDPELPGFSCPVAEFFR